MASYNGNIDLLSLNGTQVLVGIDAKNPQRPYVCIPCDLNEIRVEVSKNDANRQMAKLRVNIWPFNEQYKNKVRQSAQERGDSSVSVPTHEMQLSFSVDYIKAIAKNFPKLVEQVKEANKEKDPNIVNENFNDENTHLFKAIRARMNKRIAQLYQPQPTGNSQPYPTQAYSAVNGANTYVPPAGGSSDPFVPGADMNPDDLPF
jgi:hypothetical protein